MEEDEPCVEVAPSIAIAFVTYEEIKKILVEVLTAYRKTKAAEENSISPHP